MSESVWFKERCYAFSFLALHVAQPRELPQDSYHPDLSLRSIEANTPDTILRMFMQVLQPQDEGFGVWESLARSNQNQEREVLDTDNTAEIDWR